MAKITTVNGVQLYLFDLNDSADYNYANKIKSALEAEGKSGYTSGASSSYINVSNYNKLISDIASNESLSKQYGDIAGTMPGLSTSENAAIKTAYDKAKASASKSSSTSDTNTTTTTTTDSTTGTTSGSTTGTTTLDSNTNQSSTKNNTDYNKKLSELQEKEYDLEEDITKKLLIEDGVYTYNDLYTPPFKAEVKVGANGLIIVKEDGNINNSAAVKNSIANAKTVIANDDDVKATKLQIADLNKLQVSSSTGLTTDEINAKLISDASAKANVEAWNTYNKTLEEEKAELKKQLDEAYQAAWQEAVANGTYDRSWHKAWDPRLARLDDFLYQSAEDNNNQMQKENAVRLPFSSLTTATAFGDLTFVVEKLGALMMYKSVSSNLPSYDLGHFGIKKSDIDFATTTDETGAEVVRSKIDLTKTNGEYWSTAAAFKMLDDTAKVIISATGVYKKDPKNYAVASLMNPFSMTKLCGGLDEVSLTSVMNYMYDIRDRRRFYDMAVDKSSNDTFAVSNPTVTQLIQWSNADKWGRTPYSYLDFVYIKLFEYMPTNRLVTFRRYAVPTYDNLQFEAMYGKIETVEKDENGHNKADTAKVNALNYEPLGTFAPHATVVTYFGGDTGNTLSGLIGFKSGINWADVTAKVHDVTGEEGKSKQLTIDEMFENGGFGQSDFSGMTKIFGGMTTATNKVLSFGKFALACNGTIGQSEAVMQKLMNALQDPYGSGGPFENRIIGPVNRIETVKRRKEGIQFELSFTLKCSYVPKAIGGINPKAALLDILGNCMEMVSPTAVFWGGGHRFKITPHTYPYHDGGWRDDFMEKLYDGKLLGKGGALDAVGSGITKVLTGENGEFSVGNLGGLLKDGLGSVMGAISGGLEALGSSLAIPGVSDFISKASSYFSSGGAAISSSTAVSKGKEAITKFGKNQEKMWHDKVLQATTFPLINGMGALLTGEPVGEWHLTIGNPLNPIAVIGNLICENMQVEWDEELGPDDFPNGLTVTYNIQHGMPRDKDAIQSMFNRGMGKFYVLPDYMRVSSDMETKVDKFTGGSSGATGRLNYMEPNAFLETAGFKDMGYHQGQLTYLILAGTAPTNHGNPNTLLITKFTPTNTTATMTIADINSKLFMNATNTARIKSLGSNRKRVE